MKRAGVAHHFPGCVTAHVAILSEFNDVTSQVLLDIIRSNTVKSNQLDSLPAAVLKKCLDVLLPVLTRIVNLSMRWMLHNNKTKILVFHAKHCPAPYLDCMQVVSAELKPSEHTRNIGVIFDPHVGLDRQIASICKSAFYSIRAISCIRKLLSLDTAKILVHVLVTSKVDHCNAVLYGLPKYKIERLQYVLNPAARLVTLTRKHDHITHVLMELHWLPVEQRIEFSYTPTRLYMEWHPTT